MTPVSYPSPDKKAKLQRKLATFLRRHTDNFDWATAEHFYENGQLQKVVLRKNTKKAFLAALESKVWRYLDDPKNADYFAHFDGKAHLYAAGRRFWKKDIEQWRFARSLIYIDIDCKTIGSAEGSLALVKFLTSDECRKAYGICFPGLYSEPSSNKRGRAAWFILDYGSGDGRGQIRPSLKRLADSLNQIAAEQGFNIEKVEIKSTPSEVIWSDSEQGKIEDFTMGTLARLPRDAERLEELQATTVLTVFDLMRLPRLEKVSTVKQVSGSVRRQKVRSAGSSTGSLLSEDRFERLPYYEALAAKVMGGANATIETSGRMVATVEDLAVTLLILEACSEQMNEDGSLPTARVKAIWQQAYEDGRVDRAFHRARFSVLRDKLSSLGLLEVEDMEYRAGSERCKGQACKWKLSETLLIWLEDVRTVGGEGISVSLVQHENVDAFSDSDFPRPTPVFGLKGYLDSVILAEIDRIVGTWTPSALAA